MSDIYKGSLRRWNKKQTYRALSTLYPRSVARGTAIDFLRRLESIEAEMSGLCYRASFYRKDNK